MYCCYTCEMRVSGDAPTKALITEHDQIILRALTHEHRVFLTALAVRLDLLSDVGERLLSSRYLFGYIQHATP